MFSGDSSATIDTIAYVGILCHDRDAAVGDGLHLSQNSTAMACGGPLWGQSVRLRLTQSVAIYVDSRLSKNVIAKDGFALDYECCCKGSPALGLEGGCNG